jgi:hypothetical protein
VPSRTVSEWLEPSALRICILALPGQTVCRDGPYMLADITPHAAPQLCKHRERPWVHGGHDRSLGGPRQGFVTSKYIHTLDTALIMAAHTISRYIQGLLDGVKFKQTAYALDRDSRKAALAHFLRKAVGEQDAGIEGEERLAA